MSMVQQYFDLTKQYKSTYGSKTIVYMQCGGFYEIYGLADNDGNIQHQFSDIEIFSNITDFLIAKKQAKLGIYNVVMAGFKTDSHDKYVKKLQESGYTVVVYTQKEQKEKTERYCSGIYSPGTMFNSISNIQNGTSNNDEDGDSINHINETHLSNNIACVWLEETKRNTTIFCGITMIDVQTGNVNIYEFKLEYFHNPTTYDEIEQIISFYRPSECIVITDFVSKIDETRIENIKNCTGINNCLKVHDIDLSPQTQTASLFMKNAKKCTKQKYQHEIISSFYKHRELNVYDIIRNYPYASQSFCFLLEFVKLQNPDISRNLTLPVTPNISNKCFLANHSAKQLNMISESSGTSNRKNRFDILSLLNLCRTNMGRRKFKHVCLEPSTNVDALNLSYTDIHYVISSPNMIDLLYTSLRQLSDLENIFRKAILRRITPRDFYNIYNDMKNTIDICSCLSLNSYFSKRFEIKCMETKCKNIVEFIEKYFIIENCAKIDSHRFENKWVFDTCIDVKNDSCLNESSSESEYDEHGFIKSSAFEEYDEIVQSKLELSCILNDIVIFLNSVVGSFEKRKSTTQFIKLHYTPKQGMSILLTKKRAKSLEVELKDLPPNTHISLSSLKTKKSEWEFDVSKIEFKNHTSKSDQAIVGPEIVTLFEAIEENNNKFGRVLQSCFDEICSMFQNLYDDYQDITKFIIDVDILYCKGKMTQKYNLSHPCIKEKSNESSEPDGHHQSASEDSLSYTSDTLHTSSISYLKIKGLRHLIIETLNEDELYVTNDIELGTESQLGVLLFGTNAVGKTSLIKAIGIAIIMAQAGFYVPCKQLTFFPYEYIFTRIIGNDNIFKGLSTFAVEMSELRVIINKCNNKSLILGDELCSGTENDSAISIIVSSLEEFQKQKSNFIFATHFHDLDHLEEVKQMHNVKFKHMQVRFDREKRTLVYNRKLIDGKGESTYGLEVCKSLHLKDSFIDRAFDIRQRYLQTKVIQENVSILECEPSSYNSKKIKTMCEICKAEKAVEVHHLQYQKEADEYGYIEQFGYNFHKNHKANLCSICEKCHDKIHKDNLQIVRQKTTGGYEFSFI